MSERGSSLLAECEIALDQLKTSDRRAMMIVVTTRDPECVPHEVPELESWRGATAAHACCDPTGSTLTLNLREAAAHALLSDEGTFIERRATSNVQKKQARFLQDRGLSCRADPEQR